MSLLKDLLRPDVQEFIITHPDEDEKALVLKTRDVLGIASSLISTQIASRRKAKDKLPSFYKTSNIIYPPSLNMEQCSSEATASLKLSLINTLLKSPTPQTGVDLTGGFGVDTFFLSKACKDFDYIEPDESILEISQNNLTTLGASNINFHQTTAADFICKADKKFSFIYLDPSRRKDNLKVFRLADCQPDPVALLPELLTKTDCVLIKAAPLLDLQQGMRELRNVEKIIITAVKNDCKEIIFICGNRAVSEPLIHCINIAGNGRENEEFTFSFSQEKKAISILADPKRYLYEPNAAILKGGAFKTIGETFALSKIHQHTHLYTSDELIPNFPGRIFEIEIINPDKKDLKSFFPDDQANIIARNYPLTPEALRKKLKLGDGGEKFILGFKGVKNFFVVAATRIIKSQASFPCSNLNTSTLQHFNT